MSIYNTDGSLSTSFSVPAGGINLVAPHIAVNSRTDGGFAVSWRDGANAIQYAVYNSTPTAVVTETQVSQSAGPNTYVNSSGLTGGGSAMVWLDSSLAPSGGIVARMIDSSGALSGAEFRVDSGALGNPEIPNVAGLADGGYVVTWSEGGDVRAKVFNSDGTVRATEFSVATGAASQDSAEVDPLPSGGFAISWRDNTADGSGDGAYAATYDANGTVVTSATRLNQTTTGNQDYPVLAKHPLSDLSAAIDADAGTVKVRTALNYRNFASHANRQAAIADIDDAITTIRAAAGHFITNLALLNVRLEFTQNYSNTLSAGAGKLTLADLNEEGANALALQTRSQLGVQALTFSSQSEQAVLKLMQ